MTSEPPFSPHTATSRATGRFHLTRHPHAPHLSRPSVIRTDCYGRFAAGFDTAAAPEIAVLVRARRRDLEDRILRIVPRRRVLARSRSGRARGTRAPG